jgi:hypothetical protein
MVGYSVAYMKTRWLRKRASKEDLDALRSVAEMLGLDASSALWFLVHQKHRELALEAARISGATGSKKRRSRAA